MNINELLLNRNLEYMKRTFKSGDKILRYYRFIDKKYFLRQEDFLRLRTFDNLYLLSLLTFPTLYYVYSIAVFCFVFTSTWCSILATHKLRKRNDFNIVSSYSHMQDHMWASTQFRENFRVIIVIFMVRTIYQILSR